MQCVDDTLGKACSLDFCSLIVVNMAHKIYACTEPQQKDRVVNPNKQDKLNWDLMHPTPALRLRFPAI